MLWTAFLPAPPRSVPPPDGSCWWALAYTPRVCRLDGALLLELQASLRLFGGQGPLMARLQADARPWDWVGPATGRTAHAALVRARYPDLPLDQAPLDALPETRRHAPLLHRLGCHTLGQVRRLPRQGLARRFGTPLLQTLDQAYGHTNSTWDWLQMPERFDAHQDWPWRLEGAQALLQSLSPHWTALRAWLVGRQQGVTQLRVTWRYEPRRHLPAPPPLTVRTTQATQDTRHLQALVSERLNHIQLAAPLVSSGLSVDSTEPLPGTNLPLLAGPRTGPTCNRHELLEQLVARLGPEQVRNGRWHADPRPEHTHPWQAFADTPPAPPAQTGLWPADWAWQPPWLLEPPQPLPTDTHDRPLYQGPLTLLTRAQRIEAGWWQPASAVQRDYFVASSPQAGLLWVYREHTAPHRWFLQGLYG